MHTHAAIHTTHRQMYIIFFSTHLKVPPQIYVEQVPGIGLGPVYSYSSWHILTPDFPRLGGVAVGHLAIDGH